MSVTNPERVVTKKDLADFYTSIFPYLGGKAASGFTPVGTIISIFSETAPANYLICDGTAYNKADYPELAAHLLALTDNTPYIVSGDNTKFKVPDLRGEFLRGTGTNSHTIPTFGGTEGNGDAVGVHQTSTLFANSIMANGQLMFRAYNGTQYRALMSSCDSTNPISCDSIKMGFTLEGVYDNTFHTSRPTNTSVLFCIATKNIYMGGGSVMNYSTDEQVVGTWVSGKPLYQRTFSFTTCANNGAENRIVLSQTSIDFAFSVGGGFITTVPWGSPQAQHRQIVPFPNGINSSLFYLGIDTYNDELALIMKAPDNNWANKDAYITIQYTKTSD